VRKQIMNNNNNNEAVKITPIVISDTMRGNFSFLGETRLQRVCTVMNEGFHISIAMLFSYFDIDSHRGIVILRNRRKKELSLITRDLLGKEKMEAINSFSFTKWNEEEDKILARHYSFLVDKQKLKDKEEADGANKRSQNG